MKSSNEGPEFVEDIFPAELEENANRRRAQKLLEPEI